MNCGTYLLRILVKQETNEKYEIVNPAMMRRRHQEDDSCEQIAGMYVLALNITGGFKGRFFM